MIKVIAYEKTIFWWICPKCSHRHEWEERNDKAISDELECENCDFIAEADEWKLEE